MALLLLSCCAPCSAGVIKKLAAEDKRFTVLFFNPNITPLEEYKKRLEANKNLCKHFGIDFIELPYNHDTWLKEVALGFEDEPERGKRCKICFLYRLRQAAKYAKENGFMEFSSVLGISRYKDLESVNAAAEIAQKEFKIAYNFTNWRKNSGEQEGLKTVKELGLYLQKYCGCEFSKK
ncbi:MAG: epoxyqueuosine reductase QueH [Elusimicrobiaceae bacterium]|nr:epoxyqueuosine reductase QueH [Elusimicrobiaceae bacterium]